MGAQNLSSSVSCEKRNKLKKDKIIKSDKLTFIGSIFVFLFLFCFVFLLKENPTVAIF